MNHEPPDNACGLHAPGPDWRMLSAAVLAFKCELDRSLSWLLSEPWNDEEQALDQRTAVFGTAQALVHRSRPLYEALRKAVQFDAKPEWVWPAAKAVNLVRDTPVPTEGMNSSAAAAVRWARAMTACMASLAEVLAAAAPQGDQASAAVVHGAVVHAVEDSVDAILAERAGILAEVMRSVPSPTVH